MEKKTAIWELAECGSRTWRRTKILHHGRRGVLFTDRPEDRWEKSASRRDQNRKLFVKSSTVAGAIREPLIRIVADGDLLTGTSRYLDPGPSIGGWVVILTPIGDRRRPRCASAFTK